MADRVQTFVASWKALSYDEKQKLLRNFDQQLLCTTINKGETKAFIGENRDRRGVQADIANPKDVKHGVNLYSNYSYLYYCPTIRWDLDQSPSTDDYWVGISEKVEADDQYIDWAYINRAAQGNYYCGKLNTKSGSNLKDRNEEFELRIFDGETGVLLRKQIF